MDDNPVCGSFHGPGQTIPAYRSIRGACRTNSFALQWPQMWRERKSMQCRERRIKVLRREQSQASSYLVLHSHPLTNHVEQSAIRYKPEPATSSSRWVTTSTAAKVGIRALLTFHNIERPNLQCMKQQSTVHGKRGEWGKWSLEFHERASWKPNRHADRPTPSDAGGGPNPGSRSRRVKESTTAAAYSTR